jgi:hypothetical protein
MLCIDRRFLDLATSWTIILKTICSVVVSWRNIDVEEKKLESNSGSRHSIPEKCQ